MISRLELDLDPLIGSDRDSGHDTLSQESIHMLVKDNR